nr:RNA-directed DNA polymerase, eukaryota [Tanacetum cinerariifolium]
VNLNKKGIDVDSLLCPICNEDLEMVNHFFFSCDMAKDLWALLARWWELDIPFCLNISDWFAWLDSLSISHKARAFLEGVEEILLWHILNFRNRLVFSNSPPKKALLWDSIVLNRVKRLRYRNVRVGVMPSWDNMVGDKKYPTIMLEAVASHDLWIWHAFLSGQLLSNRSPSQMTRNMITLKGDKKMHERMSNVLLVFSKDVGE